MYRLTELLGIQYPIIQGGMAWVATARLAAAVSEAGGLGIIGAGHAPGVWVREEIKKAKRLTTKPFGVNIMLMSPHVEDVVEAVVEERVAVVTTGAGSPGPYLERLKVAGCRIMPVLSSVALARRMERMGVDAVIAEGSESGGHVGEIGTMALIPQVVDAVSIPVIAAGGIADGRGVAAAMMLGASAVQLGTVFICSEECEAHTGYKEAVLGAGDRDAIICGASTGHPVRSLRNQLTRQYLTLEKQGVDSEELEKLASGRLRLAFETGDRQMGSLMAGQSAGLVKEIRSAARIVVELVVGAEERMGRKIWTN
ncbi:MAG TPA: enoyl-[acyl-carrier-protein] reductase FabK [Bacillota bacterium]|nr:enoyl-[acyl-carrier-protein] reductase FabK [Bacillota bacterium]